MAGWRGKKARLAVVAAVVTGALGASPAQAVGAPLRCPPRRALTAARADLVTARAALRDVTAGSPAHFRAAENEARIARTVRLLEELARTRRVLVGAASTSAARLRATEVRDGVVASLRQQAGCGVPANPARAVVGRDVLRPRG